MKKIKHLFILAIACLTTFVALFSFYKAPIEVKAAVPSGQTLDTVVDTISVRDLTFNDLTGQSMISVNKDTTATFSYSAENTNKSVVFKFKYDVKDTNPSDKNAVNVYLGVTSDNKWDTTKSLWLRGDQTAWARKSGDSISYKKLDALTLGVHQIIFSRIALLDDENNPTGSYYCTLTVDGTELRADINPYDVSTLGNLIFLNYSAENISNKIYDYDLTYENPRYVSISDFKAGGSYVGNKVANKGGTIYTYDTTNQPANKSVILSATIDYKAAQDGQINIFNDGSMNWNNAGYIWIRQDKVYYGLNNADGTFKDNANASLTTPLAVGNQYSFEYGRLAIMNGETFTGKYHVYVSIDGIQVFAIDQAIETGVANGGKIRLSGDGGYDYVDAYSYEEAKQITVNDLKSAGSLIGCSLNITGHTDLTFDNTDHKEKYSLVFKFRYTATELKNNQFHITSNESKWKQASSFILNNDNGTKFNFGKGDNSGWYNLSYSFTEGKTYTIEFGRLALMCGTAFIGQYKVYLKIDGTEVATYNMTLPQEVLEGNVVFITADGKNSINSHNLTHHEAVAATCTEDGNIEYYECSECGKYFTDANGTIAVENVTVAAAHTFGEWVAEVSASCTTAGTKAHKDCTVCNKHFDENGNEIADLTIAALDHNWEWIIDKAATYTETGLKHEECSRCHEKRNENTVIDIVECEHNLVLVPAVAATCTAAGSKAYYTCSECGKHFSDAEGQLEIANLEAYSVIPALNHLASDTVYHTNEKHFNVCTRCGYVLDFEELTAGGNLTDARWTQRKYTNNWETMSGQMRVREKNGSIVVNMTAGWSMTNQYIFNFEGAAPIAKGNSFSIDLGNYWTTSKEMGVKVSLTVKVGGATQTLYVLGDANNFYNFHVTTGFETFTFVSTTEVEVYEIRITNKSTLSNDTFLYMDNLKIFTALNVDDHNLVDDPANPGVSATCTTAGKEVLKVCSCGYKVGGAEISALGHNMTHHDAVAATCTENGTIEYYSCSVCNKNFSDSEGTTEVTELTVLATHKLTKVEAVAPTLTSNGNVEYYECSECHKKFSDAEGTTEITNTELTLDTVVDSISVSDLTFNNTTGNMVISENKNTDASFEFGQNNTNRSIIFNFKYDVNDTNTSDKNAVNVYLGVKKDNKWDTSKSLWLRGEGNHFNQYVNNKNSYVKYPALKEGLYNFEFGRIAILNNGAPTNTYLVYFKIDGELIGSSITPFEASDFGNLIFFNFSELNTQNKVYDAFLTYEEAKEIGVNDLLKEGKLVKNILPISGNTDLTYDNEDHKPYYSLVFKFMYEAVELKNNQVHLTSSAAKWSQPSSFILNNSDGSKVHLGKGDASGWYDLSYSFTQGETYEVEFGRLAIMDGETFAGKYTLYLKIDGQLVAMYDMELAQDVVEGNVVFITADGKNTFYDADYVPCGDTHTLVKVEAKAATCIEDGNIEYYLCTNCSKMFGDAEGTTEVTNVTVPKAHTLTKVEAVAATCTEDGTIEYYVCSSCNKMFSDAEGATEITDIVAKAHHTLTKVDAVAPTCTTAGNIEYYECSACGKKFSDAEGATEVTDVTVAPRHTLTFHEAVQATCTEAGSIAYYECSVCGKKYSDAEGTTEVTDVTAPAQHTLTHHEAKTATCTEPGNIEYYHCSECGKNFSDAAGTNQVANVSVTAQHSLTHHEAKAATCTEDGNIEYYECSVCGKKYSDAEGTTEVADVVTNATGHKYGSDGKCEYCGEKDPDFKETKKKGCKSSITVGAGAVIALLGFGLIVIKKRREQF